MLFKCPEVKSLVHLVYHNILSIKNRPVTPGLGIQR